MNDKSYSVAFSSTGTSLGTSVLHAEFADGSENEIRFEGLDGKYCKWSRFDVWCWVVNRADKMFQVLIFRSWSFPKVVLAR